MDSGKHLPFVRVNLSVTVIVVLIVSLTKGLCPFRLGALIVLKPKNRISERKQEIICASPKLAVKLILLDL